MCVRQCVYDSAINITVSRYRHNWKVNIHLYCCWALYLIFFWNKNTSFIQIWTSRKRSISIRILTGQRSGPALSLEKPECGQRPTEMSKSRRQRKDLDIVGTRPAVWWVLYFVERTFLPAVEFCQIYFALIFYLDLIVTIRLIK